MPHPISHENISALAPAGVDIPENRPSYPPEGTGYQTIVVIDYEKPADAPDRFTAILVRPGQLDKHEDSAEPDIIQYTLWEKKDITLSVPLSMTDAAPPLLATNSRLRGSADSEERAIAAAVNNYFSSLGEMVVHHSPPVLRLQ